MDPFAQQIQRIESNDKVQQLVEALRLIPIDDAEARDQLETSLEKLLHQPLTKYLKHKERSPSSHSTNQTFHIKISQ